MYSAIPSSAEHRHTLPCQTGRWGACLWICFIAVLEKLNEILARPPIHRAFASWFFFFFNLLIAQQLTQGNQLAGSWFKTMQNLKSLNYPERDNFLGPLAFYSPPFSYPTCLLFLHVFLNLVTQDLWHFKCLAIPGHFFPIIIWHLFNDVYAI